MASIDDAFKQLWHAHDASIPYVAEHAIPSAWRDHHREWGSPLKPEIDLEDGGKAQAFSNCVVTWRDGEGVQIAV